MRWPRRSREASEGGRSRRRCGSALREADLARTRITCPCTAPRCRSPPTPISTDCEPVGVTCDLLGERTIVEDADGAVAEADECVTHVSVTGGLCRSSCTAPSQILFRRRLAGEAQNDRGSTTRDNECREVPRLTGALFALDDESAFRRHLKLLANGLGVEPATLQSSMNHDPPRQDASTDEGTDLDAEPRERLRTRSPTMKTRA